LKDGEQLDVICKNAIPVVCPLLVARISANSLMGYDMTSMLAPIWIFLLTSCVLRTKQLSFEPNQDS